MPDSITDYGHIAAGSPANAQRRALESRLRETREKLLSGTGTRPQFDNELALLFARNKTKSYLVVQSLAILAAGFGSLALQVQPLMLWLAGVLVVQALMLKQTQRFTFIEQKDRKPNLVRQWSRRFAAHEFLIGAAWSSLVFVPALSSTSSHLIFFFVVALFYISINVLLSAAVPMAMWAGTILPAAVIAMMLPMDGDYTISLLSVIVLSAEVYGILLTRRLHKNALDNLTIRAEKDVLITALEQANGMSDEARRRAEESNLAKSRFLATMSHELRTPLNAILGFSEIMATEAMGAIGNATYKDYAQDIHNSGQHLLNLINEILDLSRVEAGKMELKEEAITLVHTVEDSVRLMRLRAENKGLVLKEAYDENLPQLWADERAMRQITLNLLSNAIKFTPPSGTIYVKAGRGTDGQQYVSVRDTGPGIPEDEIETVLSSFGQGSNALKTAEQGAGLGLPIVKGLVELHGGEFIFKSKLRVGTEVTIILPKQRVMEALGPVVDKEPVKKSSRY